MLFPFLVPFRSRYVLLTPRSTLQFRLTPTLPKSAKSNPEHPHPRPRVKDERSPVTLRNNTTNLQRTSGSNNNTLAHTRPPRARFGGSASPPTPIHTSAAKLRAIPTSNHSRQRARFGDTVPRHPPISTSASKSRAIPTSDHSRHSRAFPTSKAVRHIHTSAHTSHRRVRLGPGLGSAMGRTDGKDDTGAGGFCGAYLSFSSSVPLLTQLTLTAVLVTTYFRWY